MPGGPGFTLAAANAAGPADLFVSALEQLPADAATGLPVFQSGLLSLVVAGG
jgi:hypothetical protein